MLSDILCDVHTIQKNYISQQVTVAGFVHSIRDHGGIVFIDLRSNGQFVQIVCDRAQHPHVCAIAEKLHNEYVIHVTGEVVARAEELINHAIPTGEIEIHAHSLDIVSHSKPLPFHIHDTETAGEEIRLKYRYLDLRRQSLQSMLAQKHMLFLAVRNWFDSKGFIEIQTPILANPSPEGARDYIVPSRLHPGRFYALPQAPQQFKQLLMVGGFSQYFQIAPCFRDEDPRADRHPGDFYQLDVEIAWADQEDIFALNESFACDVLQQFSSLTIPQQDKESGFMRLTYDEAMNAYGSDKPDLRYPLAWKDCKQVFAQSKFEAFSSLCMNTHENQNSRVQALVVSDAVTVMSRSELDKIQALGRECGLPGIAYIQYTAEGAKSPLFKFFGDEQEQHTKKAEIQTYLNTKEGDIVLFIAHKDKEVVFKAQDKIRTHIAHVMHHATGTFIDTNILKFVWIYNFPFFEIEGNTIDFAHNPFGLWKSFPDMNAIETLQYAKEHNELTEIRAIQYDLTVNGYEVLSGGVRNSNTDSLIEAFSTVGYSHEEIHEKFGHMIEAYSYGAPRHAGFAWGLDRLFMVLTGEKNIREIIAFPKNGQGIDAMTGAPMRVSSKALSELNIETVDVD